MQKSKAKHIAVIGAGFGGMSAAAYLARAGYRVTVFEQNKLPGGRAQVLKDKGFTFDMGPSWYMMPDVFDEFFADFGKKTSNYYQLEKLDPAYQVVTRHESFAVHSYPKVKELFEQFDPASVKKLDKFYHKAASDYSAVRRHVLDRPMVSYKEVLDPVILKFLLSPNALRSYRQRISSVTSDSDLRHMLEFMSVFMGGSPDNIPAMYTLLAYVDMGLGVSYPMGGFGVLAKAFERLAKEQGATFVYNAPVSKISVRNGRAVAVHVGEERVHVDGVVANADYHFVETQLLSSSAREYDKSYWQKKTISPSGLLIFLGVNRRLPNLLHHNLFFDADWDEHFEAIFKRADWPHDPLFYASVPSLTDSSAAPPGYENIFVLAPVAPGEQPSEQVVHQTIERIIDRLEKQTQTPFRENIVTKQWRAQDYFKDMFSAYQGNAFGLSHTLLQSAVFRPRIQSKRVGNLWYCGQYTNPGTGVPMVVLSGRVAAKHLTAELS